jgi:hypothetical protein
MPPRTHDAQIELAIADLRQQSKPNILGTAKKHGVIESTLRRRFKGQQTSISAANSAYRQRLTNSQEEALVKEINRLSERGMPPTSQFVRNFANEIIQGCVGKNWVGDFVYRWRKHLRSIFLENIDNSRKKAEYEPIFRQFYDLVFTSLPMIHF